MQSEKKIVILDAETTGVSTTADRIVQIAAMKVSADFKEREPARKYLINPQRSIPAEATAIHGITDEMVKDRPIFKQLAKGLLTYLEGCDVAGFNILDFDVPLLAEEFERAGLTWDVSGVRFFDSYRIFRDKEKRDLGAAVRFYCNREHTGAHDAGEDIAGTVDVLASQLLRYEDLSTMDPVQLAEYCRGGRVLDLAGKIKVNDQGVPVYGFGKDAGKPINANPGFASWMLKQDFATDTKRQLQKILNG